jgi:hypothetical protein
MSELQRHIGALARALGVDAFDARAVRIVELGPRDFDAAGRPFVEDLALHTIESYAERFEALLAGERAWLNLSYVGRLGDRELLAVELPAARAERPTETSVNYSGPPRAVADAGGDARAWIAPRASGTRS